MAIDHVNPTESMMLPWKRVIQTLWIHIYRVESRKMGMVAHESPKESNASLTTTDYLHHLLEINLK